MNNRPAETDVPKIFDRALLLSRWQRFGRATPDFVSELVSSGLDERLAPVSKRFARAAVLGPDARFLPQHGGSAGGAFSFERYSTLAGDGALDPENLSLPKKDHDLIVSLLDLQTVNDVPGFLARLRAHLAPDGLLLVAAIGGSTLSELREAFVRADSELSGGAYARVAPFIDVRAAGSLLQRAGFALPVTDVDVLTVRYADPLLLVRELQALSAANPLSDRPRRFLTRSGFGLALRHYAEMASDPDGRVRATLEIVWMSGWVPHESQQKPLAPGSAQVSLKTVLEKKPPDAK